MTVLMKYILLITATFVVLCNCIQSERLYVENSNKAKGPFILKSDSRGNLSPNSYITEEDDIRKDYFPSVVENDRQKRDVNQGNNTKQPLVYVVSLKDSHHQLMIDWAGEGSKVVVCVIRDAELTAASNSTVFISYNYGVSFDNRNKMFITQDKKPPNIDKFYKNEKFTSRFVFTDTINKYVYVTLDYSRTVWTRKVSFTPSDVTNHPTDALTFLVHDTSNAERKLWISNDFGETWRILSFYVKSYYWFEEMSPPALYVVREEPVGGSFVGKFQDFETPDVNPEVVISGVEDFRIKDDYLFATKKKVLLGAKKAEQLELWISYAGGPFLKAEFPNNLTHNHYYITHVIDGQIMVCVNHDTQNSNLYVSSVPRSSKHNVQFSLSLERIVYFNPSDTKFDTWLNSVAKESFADLHVVDGIRGVVIASQLSLNYTKNPVFKLALEHLTSLISFDLGAKWMQLKPPKSFQKCISTPGCSLHLGQEMSRLYPANRTVPILSKKSAPGMILATGTVGKSLKGKPGVFMSTNAGVSWEEILKGNYLYTFGDHGGIIVAVQHYVKSGDTDKLLYSIDEGETWKVYKFFNETLKIYGLMTEPGENSTVFTLFGSKPAKHEWIIITVDLKSVFDFKCTEKDYKLWSPSDALNDWKCLLGRKETYKRRIPHTNCYNGINYDRPITSESCPCARQDYECDFGFIIDEKNEECIKDKNDDINPFDIPLSCKPGDLYNHTKGYRKIPGDTCVGGPEHLYNPDETACPLNITEQEFLLLSTRDKILRYNLLKPEKGLSPLPLHDLKMVIAIEYDMKNNCLYWSDIKDLNIVRQCFDGEHLVKVIVDSGIANVEGMALDWISHNLYFVDGGKHKIELVNVEGDKPGNVRKVLLTDTVLDNPRGIALHPIKGYMYYTDWSDSNPVVARTYLDGTERKILFDNKVVGWPNGITIDFTSQRIFWVDGKLDYIASADLDGGKLHKILTDKKAIQLPFAIGVYKSLIFWDDWKLLQIYQADKTHGWGVTPISNNTRTGLVDLKAFGHWTQRGSNACGNKTSTGCTHICIGLPNNGFVCLCPDYMKEEKFGDTVVCKCEDGSVPLPSGECHTLENTCPPDFFKCNNSQCISRNWVCDGDTDCNDHSDEFNCKEVACLQPSWQCANGNCISEAWKCDYDNDCIDNSDELNCNYTSCKAGEFHCNDKKCIPETWVCDNYSDCPDGSDELNCTIPACRVNEFQCKDKRNCIPGPWRCDGESDCTDNSDELNCTHHDCAEWQFTCVTSKSKCIYISWKCDGEKDCPDGSDEQDCPNTTSPVVPLSPVRPVYPSAVNCSSNIMFKCNNGNCVPFWWHCDGHDDCGDGTDENSCFVPGIANTTTAATPTRKCNEDQFECDDGMCIWSSWVCDHDKDCNSGLDEENCHQVTECKEQEFTCPYSKGCVIKSKICNGIKDCADGFDEVGCDGSQTDSPTSTCPRGFFMCDGGFCFSDSTMCDGNHDCIDLTDEKSCSSDNDQEYFQVSSLYVVSFTNTTIEVTWNITTNNNTQVQYKPAIAKKAAVGNSNAWRNETWIKEKKHKFTYLEAYTQYVIKVYVRDAQSKREYSPSVTSVVSTLIGVPSPPVNVMVSQVDDKLHISWKPPLYPNGELHFYEVYISPPYPPQRYRLTSTNTQLIISPNITNQTLIVWVTASNNIYTSDNSENITFSHRVVDTPVKLAIESKDSSSVVFTWKPIPHVDGYFITHSRPENIFMKGVVKYNTTQPRIKVDGLAPGLTYIFSVQARKQDLLGPISSIEVHTDGQKLKPVSELKAEVLVINRTSVKLSWKGPPPKQKPWQYRVIWGKDISDIKQGLYEEYTNNTELIVKHLSACQDYMFVVMVHAPYGIGPEKETQAQTGRDALAPPKNLSAVVHDQNLTIFWNHACSDTVLYKLTYTYLINITEINKGDTTVIEKSSLVHSVTVHYGGDYEVSVKTNLSGARPTKPIRCFGPAIPAPYELTFAPVDGSFYWRNPRNLPLEIMKQNFTYVLYWSRHSDMSDASSVEVSKPPHILDLSPGVLYYVAVAIKDVDGYLSFKSVAIRAEMSIGDGIVVSANNVVGVAVSVLIVIVCLVVVVGVLAVRHRRLAHSFLSFYNTHYDSSLGTTVISTNDHNLDEDDDSPMIRGFSDDEPLIIA